MGDNPTQGAVILSAARDLHFLDCALRPTCIAPEIHVSNPSTVARRNPNPDGRANLANISIGTFKISDAFAAAPTDKLILF